MKTRRRQHSPRGTGKSHVSSKSYGRQPAARPTEVVALLQGSGTLLSASVLHRELSRVPFRVEIPAGVKVQPGDYVRATPLPGPVPTLTVLGRVNPATVASTAAICNHALREEFPPEVVAEAEEFPAFSWSPKLAKERRDWRQLPIVTIDGADARDFDDAVWAEPDGDGWHALVAIADVAHYVRPDSLLDREAKLRGNSTYFPDRVLPMLPERLSNDLCSLRPQCDRPVLGVELWLSADGRLLRHDFARGVIHSAARLTYEQAQVLLEGGVVAKIPASVPPMMAHLRGVYEALSQQRTQRGALDLDLPEVQLHLRPDGAVDKVGVRPRLLAHRLIEELMIAANVAAAETLSRMGGGGLYRIHAAPTREKLDVLRASLGPLGLTVPAPQGGPKQWAKLVAQIQALPAAPTLLRTILQSQQQAKYDPANIGHYGLALPLYAHFTSPIRRYADLVVHRALVAVLQGKKRDDEAQVQLMKQLDRTADHINATERASQQAEWEARDRLVTQHFAELVGQRFPGMVVGVQPFGCFVAVQGVAEGLLPKHALGDWSFVAGQNCFRRTRGGKGVLRLGSTLEVVLTEADALAGRLTFGLSTNDHQPKERAARWVRRR